MEMFPSFSNHSLANCLAWCLSYKRPLCHSVGTRVIINTNNFCTSLYQMNSFITVLVALLVLQVASAQEYWLFILYYYYYYLLIFHLINIIVRITFCWPSSSYNHKGTSFSRSPFYHATEFFEGYTSWDLTPGITLIIITIILTFHYYFFLVLFLMMEFRKQ